MASFLYYLPGPSPTIKPADADAAGLGYLRMRGGFNCARTDSGPDGQHGVVGRLDAGAVLADRARWMRVPDSPAWVGYDPQCLPTPGDLLREKPHDGHWVVLEDGNEWLIPVARYVNGASPLPKRLAYENGTWKSGDLLPRYTEFFAAACRFWDTLLGEASEDNQITFNDEVSLAAEALALNYRVGPVEISLLGLLSTQSESEILKAVVDWPAVEDFKKKVESGEVTLPPGEAD